MLNRSIYSLLIFIIFFAPLSFGAAGLSCETTLELAVIALAFLSVLKGAREGEISYKRNILNVFFAAYVVYLAYQLLFKITLYPYQTYLALRQALVYFALFASVTNAVKRQKDIDRIVFAVIMAGLCVSVLGILQLITGAEKIYWVKGRSAAPFFGSFLYENYFACYVSMAALLALGRLAANIYEGKRISSDMPPGRMFLRFLDNIFDKGTLFTAFSFAAMAASVFLSRSRGGMICLIASLAFLVSYFVLTRTRGKAVWIAAGLCVLAAYLLLNWIGLGSALKELGSLFIPLSSLTRVSVYLDAARLFRDYPLTGVGAGAFSAIFPLYRSGVVLDFYKYLHSDIAQFLIEAGVAGALIAIAPLAVFIKTLAGAVRNTRNMYGYCMGISAMAVFFYLGLHNTIDFCMHAPAISSLFIIILSISTALIYLGDPGRGRNVEMKTKTILTIRTGRMTVITGAAAGAVFLYLSFIVLKPLMAYGLIRAKPTVSNFKIAETLDPLNDDIYFKEFISIFGSTAERDYIDKGSIYAGANAAITEAMRLNPFKTSYIVYKGELEFWRGDYKKADLFLRRASLNEPRDPYVQMVYAHFFFRMAMLVSGDEDAKSAFLKKGAIYYSTAKGMYESVTFRSVIKDDERYRFFRESLKKEGIDAL